jgi:hypothetical protein
MNGLLQDKVVAAWFLQPGNGMGMPQRSGYSLLRPIIYLRYKKKQMGKQQELNKNSSPCTRLFEENCTAFPAG